jgi:hypothetical protein
MVALRYEVDLTCIKCQHVHPIDNMHVTYGMDQPFSYAHALTLHNSPMCCTKAGDEKWAYLRRFYGDRYKIITTFIVQGRA